MNKRSSKKLLSSLLLEIRAIPKGSLREISLKRWKLGVQYWLDEEYGLAEFECKKIQSRINETGKFKNNLELLQKIYGVSETEDTAKVPQLDKQLNFGLLSLISIGSN
jgi:hypothetical protein|tara:strand:- start:1765 stop:2088 length:324 start_codon:yes stop_codon:yes gene_type:complete